MYRIPIYSDIIKSVGWEEDVMEIEFHDGAMYEYYDVSYEEYIEFIDAPSLHAALYRFNEIYSYSRIY